MRHFKPSFHLGIAVAVLSAAIVAPAFARDRYAPSAIYRIGGTAWERIQGVFVDDAGFIYAVGQSHSADLGMTPGAYQEAKTGGPGDAMRLDAADALIVKLTPDARRVVWSTFLGGSRRDQAYGVRVDSRGTVYVVGATGSPDFPTTPGAYDRQFDGHIQGNGMTDMFVAAFDRDGGLLFSTFVGGANDDPQNEENPRAAMLLDERNALIYVAGLTTSRSFPTTPGAFQPDYGGGVSDAVIFALSADGAQLIHATYLGGSASDQAFTALARHPDGSIYLGGATSSMDFPVTRGSFQTRSGLRDPSRNWQEDGDAFVARISSALDRLVFATYLGGGAMDEVSHNQGLTVDATGRAVVIGATRSADFPVTAGAFDTTHNGQLDGFVAVLSEDGSRLDHATFLGGRAEEDLAGVSVAADGHILFGGATRSPDLPITPDAVQPRYEGIEGAAHADDAPADGLFGRLSPDLGTLDHLTYLGGSGRGRHTWLGDRVRAIWLGPRGQVVLGGVTNSADMLPAIPSNRSPRPDDEGDGFVLLFPPR